MQTDKSVLAAGRIFHFQELTTVISAHAYTEPVSELAAPAMPARRCSRSMDRADGTSTARGNVALSSGDISWHDANHTHE